MMIFDSGLLFELPYIRHACLRLFVGCSWKHNWKTGAELSSIGLDYALN